MIHGLEPKRGTGSKTVIGIYDVWWTVDLFKSAIHLFMEMVRVITHQFL